MHIPFGHILLFIAAGFIGYLQGHIASGVILMFVFQLGREVSQAELSIVPRWPEWATNKWYKGLFVWRWTAHNINDLVWAVICLAIGLIIGAYI